MRRLLICLAIAGCARAGKENSIIGGLTDAGPSDGGLIDAPQQQVTLTQTASNAITTDNSFACSDSGVTLQDSYYRVFKLSQYMITTTLHVTQVDFGIQTAAAGGGAGSQPATVNIGTYAGTPGGTTLDLTQARTISSANIKIPDGSTTTMTVPVTADIAPNTNMIVELAIPDGTAAGNKFFVGTNTDTEQAPGYLFSPDPNCGVSQPTSMQSIANNNGLGTVHLVMTVTGTTDTPN